MINAMSYPSMRGETPLPEASLARLAMYLCVAGVRPSRPGWPPTRGHADRVPPPWHVEEESVRPGAEREARPGRSGSRLLLPTIVLGSIGSGADLR
jgi:hypothetical protein